MKPTADKNTRLWLVIGGMTLVTFYAWRAGFPESLFDAYCFAILSFAGLYAGAHTYEKIKRPALAAKVEAPE